MRGPILSGPCRRTPAFLSGPVSATNYSGTPVTFTATADGTTPLYYQWLRGTNAIAGATNGSYTFIAQFPADSGASFSVLVTNSIGQSNSHSRHADRFDECEHLRAAILHHAQ